MSLAGAAQFAVAAWPFDDDFTDQVGGNDLANNNGVTLVPGKLGNAADFEKDSDQFLSIPDNADLSMGDVDFTVSFWVLFESFAESTQMLLGKFSADGSPLEYLITAQTGDAFEFVVSDGSTNTVVSKTVLGNIQTGVWYNIVAWHDSVNDAIGITYNANSPSTLSYGGGVVDGVEDFRIGHGRATVFSTNFFHDGLIDDPVVLKNYIFDSSEIDELYNGGDGVPFADWAAVEVIPRASTTIPNRRGLTKLKKRRSLVQSPIRRTLIQVKDRS